ncbi:MAG TPA: 50S ribosomal protein L18 [Pirellulaceae bacterium]|nr:50S ribosomal protein L18 [Pirellulaceae bacterium]
MKKQKVLNTQRTRRTYRVRNHLRTTSDRPRLSVFRSLKHISCQVIDDVTGRTLCSASTLDKELRSQVGYGGNKTAAEAVGKAIAERAKAAGVSKVKFDRGHFRYHGRVAALAEAARASGLEF